MIRTPLAPIVTCVALSFTLSVATAQQLRIEGRLASTPEATVAVRDVARAGGSFGVTAHLGTDPGAGLSLRRSEAFGPLGTLVFEGSVAARFGGQAAARFGATVRGGFGPVAAQVEAGVQGAPPERFSGATDNGSAPYDRGGFLALRVDGRANRELLLSGHGVAWIPADSAAAATPFWLDADASLRIRRLLGPELDGTLTLQSRFAGTDATHLAAAVGVVVAPRRAPEISVQAWLDVDVEAGATRLRPGLSSTGAWRAPEGRFAWTVAVRPGARARAPWSADASWRRELGDGTLELGIVARRGGVAGSALQATVAWEVPLDPASVR